MGDPNKGLFLMPRDYIGRILHGYYSIELKRRLVECIDSYKTLEEIGSAGIFYISAWQSQEKKTGPVRVTWLHGPCLYQWILHTESFGNFLTHT